MMKKTFKLASLTFLMFGCAVASEFRPPLNLERGSQRYDIAAAQDEESKWDLNMWTIGYSRNANKSFVKHGSNTAPLTALIFGKDSFKVSDAFAPGAATDFTEKFNANLNSTTFYPRVTYDEKGVNLGVSLGYRVFDGKGVVGIKANVPLKTVRMERDNNAETAEQGNQSLNYVLGDPRQVTYPVDRAIAAGIVAADNRAALFEKSQTVPADMYKLSLVQSLPFFRAGNIAPFLGTQTNAAGGGRLDFVAAGQAYTTEPGAAGVPTVANFGGLAERSNIPFVLFYNPDKTVVPSTGARAVKLAPGLQGSNKLSGAAAVQDIVVTIAGAPALAGPPFNAPVAAGGLDARFTPYNLQGTIIAAGGADSTPANHLFVANAAANHVSGAITDVSLNGGAVAPAGAQPFAPVKVIDETVVQFDPNTLYVFRGNLTPANAATVEETLKKNADNLWLMTVADDTGVNKVNGGQNDALKGLLARYAAESAEQWLFRNGYTMTNNQRTGLGDITINPFYDHSFSADWKAGVYLHVSIPTGGSKKMGDNPYKARLGNDNHVELGGGAHVGWQAVSWMNIRLDAMAAYALPATERINAPFKGATVRGLGPTVDADIDYAKLRASIDTTIVHPKASALATTLGYDFEYKAKDNVSLKDKKYTFKTLANNKASWFGGTWVNGTGFADKAADLDPALQAQNTERITHNVRAESSWQATEQLSLFCGGSSVPFGQYVAKMTSVYGGMNVKF